MTDWRRPEERVVITGLGAITPNGLDMPSTWDSVSNGRSGIGPITLFDTERFGVSFGGEATGFDPSGLLTAKLARRTDRFVQMALAASLEAVQHARLEVEAAKSYDVGVLVGCGCGGVWTYERQSEILHTRGPRAISPLMVPMIVPDAASVGIAMMLGARGPNFAIASACSTSLDAVGQSLETLRRGDAEVMITGGTEAALHPLALAGFDRLGALSHRNDDPVGASRPFDANRDGFVLSEGCVVLVLETLTHARARGAEPLAEVRSYAATSDAVHLTAPDPQGRGAVECMRRALKRAGLRAEDVDYINAHAPGTPVGDPIEATAIRALLGDRVFVSSTKSSTGHLLGAAGGLAIALAALALRDGLLPPTINLTDPDPACELLHVENVPKATDARVALVPAYGFGGHNSCVVLSRPTD